MSNVAILGASHDPAKYGNKAVRAYIKQGWDVYPVNPKGGEIEGRHVYASLRDVPVQVDRVTVYLPPAAGLKALPDIAAVQPREVFLNPGSESDELIEAAQALGLDPILACSILDIGVSPGEFPG